MIKSSANRHDFYLSVVVVFDDKLNHPKLMVNDDDDFYSKHFLHKTVEDDSVLVMNVVMMMYPIENLLYQVLMMILMGQ
jgi:hypothetical protein